MSSSVQVVAHRGASDEEPEHTLAAYVKAVEQGADAIECDVRLTRDGVLVCLHDRRIDRTSTGRGLVSTRTFKELSKYDFSGGPDSWRDFEEPRPDETRTRVLTLRTLIATMLEASPTVQMAIETKHPTRYGKYVERSLLEMMNHFGLAHPSPGSSRVRMMSFSQLAVRRFSDMAPAIPTVMLMERIPPWFQDGSLPKGVLISGVSIDVLRKHPSYAERVHAHGGRVHVWTVDDAADVELCVRLGVEAIITNRPAEVLAMLGR